MTIPARFVMNNRFVMSFMSFPRSFIAVIHISLKSFMLFHVSHMTTDTRSGEKGADGICSFLAR